MTISPGLHGKESQQGKLPRKKLETQGNKKVVDENTSRKAIAPAKRREESDSNEENL